MFNKLCIVAVFAALCMGGSARPPANAPLTVVKANGGSVRIEFDAGVFVHEGSTLTKEWFTANTPDMPVTLLAESGTSIFRSRTLSEYRYKLQVSMNVRSQITAFEIKSVLFDAFGHYIRTIRMSHLSDLPTKPFSTSKDQPIKDDRADLYTSFTFISRVRTSTGKVIEADTDGLFAAAKAVIPSIELKHLLD